ncbi:Homeodomain-like protein [Cynara cardunculus var. scolymus]|uniref:Homeodomain-like protein n=1 Tax=Cynara cardunculus var. scolymus TaxID=59895 RepID=A0A103XXW7_CYNCS|nr:Homeodomain-like protein [Cynara cardunculus var. scolymus]
MVRPLCCDKLGMRKGSWNEEEDAQMLAFVTKQPTGNWQVGAPRKPDNNNNNNNKKINTFFISNQEIQQIPETLFPNFNNSVKMEPSEVIKPDSLDLLTQLQAITHVKDPSTNPEISLTQFHVSLASSSSSSSSTCSATLNEATPQQTFNWRDFLIENSQDGNVNDESFEAMGGIEVVKGNNTNTPLMKGSVDEEGCDGSFVEAMLDGENDMLLDFPGLLGEPVYY